MSSLGLGRLPVAVGTLLTPPRRSVKAAAMTSRISHTSFDAINAYEQSLFWSRVLDFTEDPDDPNEPAHEECLIMSPDGSQLVLFINVPDSKQVKNRVHLDLRPTDRTREQEVERLLALGASQVADHRRPDGSGWITLADPEGNEFCILSKDPADSGATT
jgi:Glyoxalase-like domain